jgi:hypothetical protein
MAYALHVLATHRCYASCNHQCSFLRAGKPE